jgi:hypothetical protein
MTAACKSPKFRKKVGIPKDVACDFHNADKGKYHEDKDMDELNRLKELAGIQEDRALTTEIEEDGGVSAHEIPKMMKTAGIQKKLENDEDESPQAKIRNATGLYRGVATGSIKMNDGKIGEGFSFLKELIPTVNLLEAGNAEKTEHSGAKHGKGAYYGKKGDFKINARGSIAMVEKAIQENTLVQMLSLALNPVFGQDPKKVYKELLKAKRMDPERTAYTEEELAAMQQQPPPKHPSVEAAEIRAKTALHVEDMRGQTVLKRAAIDTDRDTAYNNSLAERDRIAAQSAEAKRLQDYQLALAKYANDRAISLEEAKVELAKLTMELQTQVRLAAAALDMVVLRLPPAHAPTIIDARSGNEPHHIGAVMKNGGFYLEHAGNDGAFGEWVAYYRRTK